MTWFVIREDDTVACRECYDSELDESYGNIPQHRYAFAETDRGTCEGCGASTEKED